METKKPLNEYITDWKNQKQLANVDRDKISVLIIKTDYIYPDFPIIVGGIMRAIENNNKQIYWKCCITYNSFNKLGDVEIVTSLDEDNKEDFDIMLKKIIGD